MSLFSLGVFMDDTLVFIDAGFLSEVSKFIGNGKYIKFKIVDFVNNICKKEKLNCEKTFFYTAHPFQHDKPSELETKRQENYDKFKNNLIGENIIFREGRCQRLKIDGEFVYRQKGVDTLLTIDLARASLKYKNIKRLILVSNDSDFVPVIRDLQDEDNVKVILYTYFERGRKVRFSTSNDLIKNVYKYIKIRKEDFE